MTKRKSYIQIITQDISEDPDWAPYAKGETSVPYHRAITNSSMGEWFFYLGDIERGREVSYIYATHCKEQATTRNEYDAIYFLFYAALHYSLSQKHTEAEPLWQDIVNKRRKLLENKILQWEKAHIWVYEAYALAKLGRYDEVAKPANQGFKGICQRKGIQPAPHKNSCEYGLAAVLKTLAIFKLDPTPIKQQETQKALGAYKKENARYGRLGYCVIFDLQFSYPDVFTPVLPGADPNKD